VCRTGSCRHDPAGDHTPCADGVCCGVSCEECCTPDDCPLVGADCTVAACNAGTCGTGPAPAGTWCGINGTCCGLVEGAGDCCDSDWNDCYTAACGPGGCELTCRAGSCGLIEAAMPPEPGPQPRLIPPYDYCSNCSCLFLQ
jgi:hypothetical protein